MTTLALPISAQQFVIEDVGWMFYESLLKQLGDQHVFVTYDDGRLELMSPSWEHDKRGRRIGLLINVLAEELRIPIEGGGSTTFRRRDLKKGLEPDQCFYVKNVDRVRGKKRIDLSVDPPPDLAIEVEVSRRVLPRIPVYESLGVPELWRDDGQHVRLLHLRPDGSYRPIKRSHCFPMLHAEHIEHLLRKSDVMDEMNWMRSVREWIRSNLVKA